MNFHCYERREERLGVGREWVCSSCGNRVEVGGDGPPENKATCVGLPASAFAGCGAPCFNPDDGHLVGCGRGALCPSCRLPRTVVPSPTIAHLTGRVTERLEVLARVTPILDAAIRASSEPTAMAMVAVRISQAILKGE